MDRRDLMKSGLCFLGGAWIGCSASLAVDPGSDDRGDGPRSNPRLKDKTFPLKLKPFWTSSFESHLYWLKSMLERLGNEVALAVWKDAFQRRDDGLLEKILAAGWEPYAGDGAPTPAEDELLESYFASAVEGVSKSEARRLVEKDPSIRLPRKRFPSLLVQKEVTTYSSLHLRLDGIARLVETLMGRLGKQGELVAYDITRAWRTVRSGNQPAETAEVLKEWADSVDSKERNAYTAGLDLVLVKESEHEVVIQVKACEWARYFTERHPTVSYLVSCSTDDAALLATNPNLRMQRTSTIMEGGKACDFRVYAV